VTAPALHRAAGSDPVAPSDVTILSRAGGMTATARSQAPSGSYAPNDPQPGPTAASHQQGSIVRRILLTLLAIVCAATALSGCGAPLADAVTGAAPPTTSPAR
jgi:hypothetical protein